MSNNFDTPFIGNAGRRIKKKIFPPAASNSARTRHLRWAVPRLRGHTVIRSAALPPCQTVRDGYYWRAVPAAISRIREKFLPTGIIPVSARRCGGMGAGTKAPAVGNSAGTPPRGKARPILLLSTLWHVASALTHLFRSED